MATPRFSILIPTRDRPATFRHTLATVAAQQGDDYEIVVADNCGSPETRSIVDEVGAGRVRYARSDEVLPMSVNWERGLALCSGEYVTVLGDDDGFLPSTLQMTRKLIDATGSALVAWPRHTYWWPDTIVPWARHQMVVTLGNSAAWKESRPTLVNFYRGHEAFGNIPMIYRGFYQRGLIEEAMRQFGGFFVPPEAAPDVASGILGLHLTDRFVWSARPLTVGGNSGKSNGTAQWARSLGAKQREIYLREERVGLKGLIHEDLVPSPNLHIIIASAKLKCKDAYFPFDEMLSVDLNSVLHDLLGDLGREADAYEENLHDAKALAAKIGVTIDPATIPPKEHREHPTGWGPLRKDGSGEIHQIVVNTEIAGIRHVADAARFIDAIMPPAETYLE
jgi:glycosyltransferase involved in cell wall biosynthesis